jgi:hypothetical protein
MCVLYAGGATPAGIPPAPDQSTVPPPPLPQLTHQTSVGAAIAVRPTPADTPSPIQHPPVVASVVATLNKTIATQSQVVPTSAPLPVPPAPAVTVVSAPAPNNHTAGLTIRFSSFSRCAIHETIGCHRVNARCYCATTTQRQGPRAAASS